LTLVPASLPPVADIERLNVEVLDLLRHAMRSRWPDMFVFKGGKGISEASIELSDLGRAWPAGQKGFHYSVSLVLCQFTDFRPGSISVDSIDHSFSSTYHNSVKSFSRSESWKTRKSVFAVRLLVCRMAQSQTSRKKSSARRQMR
jgi:hypothetical protein